MYALDPTHLLAGDVILTRSGSRESRLIRETSGSEFSHALLYVGQASCIESDGLGVRSQNVLRVLVEAPEDVAVYRADGASASEIAAAIVFARRAVGTEYGTAEARRAARGTIGRAEEPNRQFCTRVVAQAYAAAGVSLSGSPDYCGPSEIEGSTALRRVDVPVVEVSPEEAEDALRPSILDRQLDIQNDILERSRSILGEDVQTLEQLVQSVVDHPEYDGAVADVIIESGYCELGDEVIERAPYLFDYAKFVLAVPDERKDEVAAQLAMEPQVRGRWEVTLAVLAEVSGQTRLRVPEVLASVMRRQVLLSQLRESVGRLHQSLGLKCP